MKEYKYGIVDNLIREMSMEDIISLLETNMCDDCKSKINNILANRFVEDNIKNETRS